MNHEENAKDTAQLRPKKYIKKGRRRYCCKKCNASFRDRRSVWSHYQRKHVKGYYEAEVKQSYKRELFFAKRIFRLSLGNATLSGNIVGLRKRILENCEDIRTKYRRSHHQMISMLTNHIELDNNGLRNLILMSCRKLWLKRYIEFDFLQEIRVSLTDDNLSLLRKELVLAKNELVADTSKTQSWST